MSISKQQVNTFLSVELDVFKEVFKVKMIPAMQDWRGLAIAWVCYYFKDLVSDKNREKIIEFLEEVYSMENLQYYGWYRIPSLETAAFILTQYNSYLNRVLANIGCGQGWARSHFVECAGLALPYVKFDNEYLRTAVEFNLEKSQIYFEESVCLYLLSTGKTEDKRKWIAEQKEKLIEKKWDIKFFDKLENKSRFWPMPFFLESFNKAKSYFIFKIMSYKNLEEEPMTLFDTPNFEELWKKEEEHPLNKRYLNFEWLFKDSNNSH